MFLQIKCLLELNCVFPVPFNSSRAFVALGSRVVEGTKIRIPSRAATKIPVLTVEGVERKERESPVGLFFIMDATWPQGAAADRWNRITSFLPKFLQMISSISNNSIQQKSLVCTQHKWLTVVFNPLIGP